MPLQKFRSPQPDAPQLLAEVHNHFHVPACLHSLPCLSGNCPVHWPYHWLSCSSRELIIHFWPLPILLPSDVPVPIAKFSLTPFPLPLRKRRQCRPALSLSFLSINFIFICYLQALEKRSEGCTFPRMSPLSSPNVPCSTSPEPFTSLPYLVASSHCFLRRVLMAQVFTSHLHTASIFSDLCQQASGIVSPLSFIP